MSGLFESEEQLTQLLRERGWRYHEVRLPDTSVLKYWRDPAGNRVGVEEAMKEARKLRNGGSG